MPKTILFTNWGPLVTYDGETVHVADINPEIETRWRLSRWEVFVFGFKAMFAAVFARTSAQAEGAPNA